MIITRTPYRVSFAGGGTDLPAFYEEEEGAVLSAAINYHMYVTVHHRFERNFRVAYSRTEQANSVDAIEHDLVREALRLTGVTEPLEINTIGDVPAGTGLGSSSSLAVGLLFALHNHCGRVVSADEVASQACHLEINCLQKPIGRQDQYAAAFGGLHLFRFRPDHTVGVEPVPCRAEVLAELEKRVLILYTERTRNADSILKRQTEATAMRRNILRRMRDLAGEMRQSLCGRGDLDEFARLLHRGWEWKRSLGCGISNMQVDAWYQTALKAGAQGGKLLGAGGGGFLFLMAPPERHAAISAALGEPRRLAFKIAPEGSHTLFIHR